MVISAHRSPVLRGLGQGLTGAAATVNGTWLQASRSVSMEPGRGRQWERHATGHVTSRFAAVLVSWRPGGNGGCRAAEKMEPSRGEGVDSADTGSNSESGSCATSLSASSE